MSKEGHVGGDRNRSDANKLTTQRRDQASRAISTARLKRLHALHLPPINLVVSQGPSGALRLGSVHLEEGFPLRCFQRLSPRDVANRRCLKARQPGHERSLRPGPLVLGSAPLNTPTPTTDTDRTVSRRSEPSSCTALTGEQPDPWDLLRPQDAISRHRGAKPRRRYELSGAISLLSPAYLLSVER